MVGTTEVLKNESVLLNKAKKFVEAEIRPMIQGDGGDIEVADLTPEGILQLKIVGQCVNCASLPLTMTMFIEDRIKAEFPEITGVEQLQ